MPYWISFVAFAAVKERTMPKRRTAFLLILGILVGLFATACAGAFIGQSSDAAGSPSLFGPMFETLSLPALGLAPAAEANAMRSMGLGRAAELLLQAQEQMMLYGFGECERAHYTYFGDDG
jgi:hypothetical protein